MKEVIVTFRNEDSPVQRFVAVKNIYTVDGVLYLEHANMSVDMFPWSCILRVAVR